MGKNLEILKTDSNPEDAPLDLDVEVLGREMKARMLDRARRVRYAIYRSLGRPEYQAAKRAGFSDDEASDPRFIEDLEALCWRMGLFAEVEIPIREVFMSEVQASVSKLIYLRDYGKTQKIQKDCAMSLLNLAGYSATAMTRITPLDVAENEMKNLSLSEQTRLIGPGRTPAISDSPPPDSVTKMTDTEINQKLLEVEKENGSLLA